MFLRSFCEIDSLKFLYDPFENFTFQTDQWILFVHISFSNHASQVQSKPSRDEIQFRTVLSLGRLLILVWFVRISRAQISKQARDGSWLDAWIPVAA